MKRPSIPERSQRISRRFREAADDVFICGRSESVGTSPACESRDGIRPIPTGLRPPAQGCAARATLGKADGIDLNPNGVVPRSRGTGHNPVGVGACDDIGPRVARGAQPWALGRNPFGIQERGGPSGAGESRASVLECGSPLPLFHPPRPCESARGLAQSKTSRQKRRLMFPGETLNRTTLEPRPANRSAEHCSARTSDRTH